MPRPVGHRRAPALRALVSPRPLPPRDARAGDVGSYHWTLEGKGTFLTLTPISPDPCAARERALTGPWVRADLPPPPVQVLPVLLTPGTPSDDDVQSVRRPCRLRQAVIRGARRVEGRGGRGNSVRAASPPRGSAGRSFDGDPGGPLHPTSDRRRARGRDGLRPRQRRTGHRQSCRRSRRGDPGPTWRGRDRAGGRGDRRLRRSDARSAARPLLDRRMPCAGGVLRRRPDPASRRNRAGPGGRSHAEPAGAALSAGPRRRTHPGRCDLSPNPVERSQFDDQVAQATPIIETFEFHAQTP